jgi:hypothetical protein
MPVPYQRWIVGGIWAVALVESARQGLTVPDIRLPNDRQSFWITLVFSVLAPPLLAIPQYFYWRARPYRPGVVGRWFDERWGAGSALSLLQSLRPPMLVGCAALLFAVVGLCSALRAGSDLGAFSVVVFFMIGGAWFVLGSIWLRRVVPHAPF